MNIVKVVNYICKILLIITFIIFEKSINHITSLKLNSEKKLDHKQVKRSKNKWEEEKCVFMILIYWSINIAGPWPAVREGNLHEGYTCIRIYLRVYPSVHLKTVKEEREIFYYSLFYFCMCL